MSSPSNALTVYELRLLARAQNLLRSLNDVSLAGLNPPRERTEYKHKHKGYKPKGGHPPVDYTAVELKIDLEMAVKNRDFSYLGSTYYRLGYLVGYFTK